jgi:nucleoside-diphosphate-sugar epimerase
VTKPNLTLVTGSAGRVGAAVCQALRERGHRVRAFDRRPTAGVDDAIVGDLTDPAAVDSAVDGADVVLHIGATPAQADFMTELLPNNIVGLYTICEAARKHGVRRLVLTSSGQVVKNHPWRERTIRLEDGLAPDDHYACTKVFAEVMGEIYASRYGLSVVAVRLGWVPRDQKEADLLASDKGHFDWYLSPPDVGRFYSLLAESDHSELAGFTILSALSRSPDHPPMDTELAQRLLGYDPQDTYPENLPPELRGPE